MRVLGCSYVDPRWRSSSRSPLSSRSCSSGAPRSTSPAGSTSAASASPLRLRQPPRSRSPSPARSQVTGEPSSPGLAFSIMAALLCLHGAATPGFIVGVNGVVAFTGAATLPVGCAILALGSLPALRHARSRPPAARRARARDGRCASSLGLSAIIRGQRSFPSVPEPRRRRRADGARRSGSRRPASCSACASLRTYRLTHRFGRPLRSSSGSRGSAPRSSPPSLYGLLATSAGGSATVSRSAGIALVGIPVARDLRAAAPRTGRGRSSGDLRGSRSRAAGRGVPRLARARAARRPRRRRTPRPRSTRAALRCSRAEVGDELGLPPGRLRNARDRWACSTTSASSSMPRRRARSKPSRADR